MYPTSLFSSPFRSHAPQLLWNEDIWSWRGGWRRQGVEGRSIAGWVPWLWWGGFLAPWFDAQRETKITLPGISTLSQLSRWSCYTATVECFFDLALDVSVASKEHISESLSRHHHLLQWISRDLIRFFKWKIMKDCVSLKCFLKVFKSTV